MPAALRGSIMEVEMSFARLPKLLSLMFFVLVFMSNASAAPEVVATLTKSVDNGLGVGGDQKVRLHSGVSVTGFAAKKPGKVFVKIYSLNDMGANRTKYADLDYEIITDAAGAASTPPETTAKPLGFFRVEEEMHELSTWDEIKAKFNSRKFKIYVTVKVDGVEKEIDYTTPIAVVGGQAPPGGGD
jgi:hypothetical protein